MTSQKPSPKKPVALIILDGWGMREMETGNAVMQANTPNYARWLHTCERSVLDASGEAVGLPAGQMGNSEVGHLNLGAGRTIYQDISRIDLTIRNDELANIELLQKTIADAKESGSTLHLVGLIGTGGVHSHSRHLYALLDLLNRAGIAPTIHGITDGRDTPPRSAEAFVAELESFLATGRGHGDGGGGSHGGGTEGGTEGATGDTTKRRGTIATISGRYHAMDRDRRWERTGAAYAAMVNRQGEQADSAMDAVRNAYAQDVTDEFIIPTIIGDPTADHLKIKPGDSVLCFNFRADRMRQLVRMLTNTQDGVGDGFELDEPLSPLNVLTMTEYESDLPTQVVFAPQEISNPLAQVISESGGTQLHAAETEKYAHVTYFFNGGEEEAYPGEERFLAQSPKVATYDLKPEMSAFALAEGVVQRIQNHDDAFVLVNFANPDMVGHTGVLEAAIRAVEATDACAGQIVEAIIAKGGVALVTADHGNAERMIELSTGDPHTYHTTNPVALLAIGEEYINLRPRGILADVAPTVLALLGIQQPEEMTGDSLLA